MSGENVWSIVGASMILAVDQRLQVPAVNQSMIRRRKEIGLYPDPCSTRRFALNHYNDFILVFQHHTRNCRSFFHNKYPNGHIS
jgi:hypothetical protein